MRLFVAIQLSDEIKKNITGTLHDLKPKEGARACFLEKNVGCKFLINDVAGADQAVEMVGRIVGNEIGSEYQTIGVFVKDQELGNSRICVFYQKVVGVNEGDVFAACLGEGKIACAGGTAVFLGKNNKAIVFLRVCTADIEGIVRRAVVNEDIFDVTVFLIEERVQTVGKVSCRVIYGNDYRDLNACFHESSPFLS